MTRLPDSQQDNPNNMTGRATYTRSTRHTTDTWVNSDATEYVHRLEDALYRIGTMNTNPRPDGSYNYDRAALIQIARDALEAK